MLKKFLKTIKMRLLRISLILGLILFSINATAWTEEVKVITNIAEWHHPVKDVFKKHKVKLYKVELNNKTYPIFYVKFPYDPSLGHNNSYFTPLYYETAKANGFWDYSFIDYEDNCRINIKWDKKTKTLTQDHVELAAPGEEGAPRNGAAASQSAPEDTRALPPPPPLPD